MRKPDPEIVHDNESVAICIALIVGIFIGATFAAWFWA